MTFVENANFQQLIWTLLSGSQFSEQVHVWYIHCELPHEYSWCMPTGRFTLNEYGVTCAHCGFYTGLSVMSQPYMCSGPCILGPPLQPEKYGLKLKAVLKWRDIYIYIYIFF